MTIPENLIIPLALALVGTLFGSYLTAVLKLYLWMPPKMINWFIGIAFYIALVLTGKMPLDISTAALYTICVLGGQKAYDIGLRGVWDHVNEWARGKPLP